MSLVDIHGQLSSYDNTLEKEAAVEWEKIAEEDAAGRIMARGFMDELHKLADDMPANQYNKGTLKPMKVPGGAQTIKAGPYKTGPAARLDPFAGKKRRSLMQTSLPKAKSRVAKIPAPKR